MTVQQKPYGMWSSLLTSSSMAGALRLSNTGWSGDGKYLVWLEGRDGRGVLVARKQGDVPRDLHDELSVRGGVGYGGGEFVVHEQDVFFAAADGGLYKVNIEKGAPKKLIPPFGKVASPAVSPDGKWIVFVHTHDGVDVLAAVDTDGKKWPAKLVQGDDFYMQPTWHPDGKRIAWVSWNHPQMPWNGTQLFIANIYCDETGIHGTNVEQIAGDEQTAIFQPEFSPDGRYLAYISDKSGWSHLYLKDLDNGTVQQLTSGEVEFGTPAWVQGLRTFAWMPDSSSIVGVQNQRGVMSVVKVDLDGTINSWSSLENYEAFSQPAISSTGELAILASSSSTPAHLVTSSDASLLQVERYSSSQRLPAQNLAPMKPVAWPTSYGSPDKHNNSSIQEIYGNYYPPTNPAFKSTGKPPALIMIHGGPTSQRTASFEASNQFFASRGFAVMDVNYRGSTGYGREYMNALFGQWGIADVEDAVGAAKYLIDNDLADPNKIVIMGGSAGGYTVLQAMVNHPGIFAAGVCLYGISNLFALQMGTHKFEAYYNDTLLGPLPEASDIYRERSPLYQADNISDPVAVYHGALDEVVPLDQAEAIVSSLKSRKVPHFYHVYDDEGHGWRRAKNIVHFHDSLLAFLKEHVVLK